MNEAKSRKIEILDQLRGGAILAVFLYHALGASFGHGHLPWNGMFRSFDVAPSFLLLLPATFGWAGVAVFFVVSGMCIHISFDKNPNWSIFLSRRFFRIYPPYLAALALFAFIYPSTRGESASSVLSHFLLLHNAKGEWFFDINPSFWSIAVEAQLYAIYPILLWISHRVGISRAIWIAGGLEFSIRLICAGYAIADVGAPRIISSSPFAYWWSWSIGVAVADAWLKGARLPCITLPPSLVAVAAIAATFTKPTQPFAFPLFALVTACVISRSLAQPTRDAESSWLSRHIASAGVWSFSIYLLHQPLLYSARDLVKTITADPLAISCILAACWALILPLAWMSYRWIEIPSIRLGSLLSKWRYTRRSPVTGAGLPEVSIP